MKLVAASACALMMLTGAASAGEGGCDWMTVARSAHQPAQEVATATIKQMVATYLKELSEEKKIA